MTDRLAANLLAYAIQIGVVVVAATVLIRLLRIMSARARLGLWRTVLVACLTLPVVQPWTPAPAVDGATLKGRTTQESPLPIAPLLDPVSVDERQTQADDRAAIWPWILLVIAAGIAGRLAWLAIGFASLRHLRREARRLEDSTPALLEAFELTETRADVRVSPAVSDPVTFGARRPTVLVPERFLDFTRREQTAVVCHELLHVRRHDWLATIAEEIVRTIFWFHPAMWWVVDQIHLSREQLVDRSVVSLIGDRQPYLQALWRLVSHPPAKTLRPAAAFLGRAHLTQRVALLVTEVPMSKLRLACSLAAVGAIVAGGATAAARAFPMVGAPALALPSIPSVADPQPQPPPPPPEPARGGVRGGVPGGVQPPPPPPVPAAPRRIKNVDPLYPGTEPGFNRAAMVALAVTIDAAGRVTNVERMAGDEPFLQSAIDAARQWQFERPARAPITLRYIVNFPAPSDTQGRISSRLTGRQTSPPPPPPPPPAPPAPDASAAVMTVKFSNASLKDVVNFVTRQAGLAVRYEADVPDRAVTIDMEKVSVDRMLDVVMEASGLTYRYVDPRTIVVSRGNQQPKLPRQALEGAVRVGGNIKPPQKLVDVPAVYPEEARQANVIGTVIIEAVIGTDGKVRDARVLRSIPLLNQAALDAVRQWEYVPTLLNGVPTAIILTVTVKFPPE